MRRKSDVADETSSPADAAVGRLAASRAGVQRNAAAEDGLEEGRLRPRRFRNISWSRKDDIHSGETVGSQLARLPLVKEGIALEIGDEKNIHVACDI